MEYKITLKQGKEEILALKCGADSASDAMNAFFDIPIVRNVLKDMKSYAIKLEVDNGNT